MPTLERWAIPRIAPSLDRAPAARRDADARRELAAPLGLPWPPPPQPFGRPSRLFLWQKKLSAIIRGQDELPCGITAEPPAWWRPGMDLVQPVAVEEVEALAAVAVPEPAAPELAVPVPEPAAPVPEPAVPVPEPSLKRRKVTVDSFVREWFLQLAVLQKAQKGWGMARPLAAAKRFAPEVFKDINRNTPYRWTSSKEAAHSTGQPCMLSGAQFIVLSEQVAAVADRLPVSVATMRAVITCLLYTSPSPRD